LRKGWALTIEKRSVLLFLLAVDPKIKLSSRGSFCATNDLNVNRGTISLRLTPRRPTPAAVLYSVEMLPLPNEPGASKPYRPGQRLHAYRNLRLQDPPRNVTLKPIAKLTLVLPLFLLWILYLNLVLVLRHPRQTGQLQLLALFGIPVLLAVIARVITNSIAQRALLHTGSCSIGTVIANKSPGSGASAKAQSLSNFP